MEFLGEAEGIRVFDDYGHHPTEIRSTIEAFRLIPAKRRIGLFQPHRYSRTRLLAAEFGKAFAGLDMLVVTDIYAASEAPIRGVTGRSIADRVTGVKKVVYVQDKKEIPAAVLPLLEEGDMVVTFGAGDIYKTGHALLDLLKKRR
jgi:UDP-N-acetylmuramate--alanine ligase